MTDETATDRLASHCAEGLAEQVWDKLAEKTKRRDSPYSLSAIRAILDTATSLTRPLGEGEEAHKKVRAIAALEDYADSHSLRGACLLGPDFNLTFGDIRAIEAALRSPQGEETLATVAENVTVQGEETRLRAAGKERATMTHTPSQAPDEAGVVEQLALRLRCRARGKAGCWCGETCDLDFVISAL